MSAASRIGGIHPWARVGGPPEHHDWFDNPDLPCHPPQVDPTATIQPYVTIDSGCKDNTRVGAGTRILAHAHLGHDVQVGDRVTIATGAVIGGYAVIDDDVRIGINATVLPFRRVGAHARVGAGAVVTRDVPVGAVVVGNPARMLADDQRDPRPFTERGA